MSTTAVANRLETASTSRRLIGVDAFRLIGFAGVVLLHTVAGHPTPEVDVSKFVDLLCHFAVPYFFLVSGYFAGVKANTTFADFLRTIRRVGVIFLFWAVLYCALQRTPPRLFVEPRFLVQFLLDGAAGYHLWFLTSLIINLALARILIKLFGMSAALAIASAFYLVGVYDSEHGLLALNGHWDVRDGPTFGLLFVLAGFAAGRTRYSPSMRLALFLVGLGILLEFAEATFLYVDGINGFAKDIDIYFGTLPFGLGVFFVALNINKPNAPTEVMSRLGRYTLGFYCVHVLWIKLLAHVVGQGSLGQNTALAILTFVFSIASVLVVAQMKMLRPLVC